MIRLSPAIIAIAASISTTATGFIFEGLGHWEGFLILAAASAIATALLWAAMPETSRLNILLLYLGPSDGRRTCGFQHVLMQPL